MWNREQKVPFQVPFLGVRRQTTCASNSTWVIYPRMVRPSACPNSQSLSGRVFPMVSRPSIAGLLLISLCSLGATAYPPENPIAHQQGSWQVVRYPQSNHGFHRSHRRKRPCDLEAGRQSLCGDKSGMGHHQNPDVDRCFARWWPKQRRKDPRHLQSGRKRPYDLHGGQG